MNKISVNELEENKNKFDRIRISDDKNKNETSFISVADQGIKNRGGGIVLGWFSKGGSSITFGFQKGVALSI
jgi:hypothetical protein